MTREVRQVGITESGIYRDLQTVVREGFHRFRGERLSTLPYLLGFTPSMDDRAVGSAVRRVIRDQIPKLPSEDWRDFAERIFGLTDDTANAKAGKRERIAGEALDSPAQPSSVRARGGPREVVLMALAAEIHKWMSDDWGPGFPPPQPNPVPPRHT